MAHRLCVSVLGNRNSGKSTTWNTLFGKTVRTGQAERELELRPGEFVKVFLISGSPEERHLYAGDILEDVGCQIVLCSMQYTSAVSKTLDYFTSNGFDFHLQWLNPGHDGSVRSFDSLGLINQLLDSGAAVTIRNGSVNPQDRVQELREVIYGWALYRGLISKN